MLTPDLGLGPASRALVRQGPQERATHAVYPPTGAPRLLVPLRPSRVAAASVRRYTTPSSARTRGLLRLGSSFARLGLAKLAPRGVALGGLGTFVDHLQEILDQDLLVGVHLGPPRANRKPVLHLMDRSGGSIAYAKLGVNQLTCRRVRTESAALSRLARVSTSGLVTPSLVDAGVWEGLDYLVTRPVQTWAVTRAPQALRERAVGGLVGAFPTSSSILADAPWWSRIVSGLDDCGDDRDATRLRRVAARLAESHGDKVILSGAGHGDWSPWNMCPQPGELVVWDWERFALDVPVGWDELHFSIAAHPRGAAAALSDPRTDLIRIPQRHGSSAAVAIVGAYLLNRAINFVHDRQAEADAPNGPLGTWLLPALEDLMETPGPA